VKNQTESNANEPIVPSRQGLLAPYWEELQDKLLPRLEQGCQIELTPGLRRVAMILEIVRIEEHVHAPKGGGRGRKEIDRQPLARAFLAKAIVNLPDTRALIEQLKQSRSLHTLCGMTRVPSEATFSRAFAAFAHPDLGERVHRAMVGKFVSGQIVLHVSQDATAVEAREKAVKKVKPLKVKKSRVAPEKGKNDLPRSQPGCSDRSRWRLELLWRNFLASATGVSSGTPMATSTGGVATRRTCLGRMG
jgi:transposase